jgi:hypothetical protein
MIQYGVAGADRRACALRLIMGDGAAQGKPPGLHGRTLLARDARRFGPDDFWAGGRLTPLP